MGTCLVYSENLRLSFLIWTSFFRNSLTLMAWWFILHLTASTIWFWLNTEPVTYYVLYTSLTLSLRLGILSVMRFKLFVCDYLTIISVSTVLLWIIIFWSSLASNTKSMNFRFIQVNFWRHLNHDLVPLNKQLRKRTSKISTIKIRCRLNSSTIFAFVLLHHVHFLALWAEQFYPTTS